MKVLVIETYYWPFLVDNGLDREFQSHQSKQEALGIVDSLNFGTGAIYARNLQSVGHEAKLVIANSPGLQLPAATNSRFEKFSRLIFRYSTIIARAGFLGELVISNSKFFRAIQQQIRAYMPDVVLVLDINLFSSRLVKKLVQMPVILSGEIASPLPPKRFIKSYDLIFSAHPGLVKQIERTGVKAIWCPLGTDPEAFRKTPPPKRDIDAVFVGSFGRLQKNTGPLLAEIKKQCPTLQIFGNVSQKTLEKFGLSDTYMGPAWGSQMYEILRRSKISINRHGEIAGPFAANMRMYESTGSGALLITEEKSNLKDLFIPGVEVVTYKDNLDAATKVRYFLDHPNELKAIASAGQRKTLNEHTYEKRVAQMIQEISKLVIGKIR